MLDRIAEVAVAVGALDLAGVLTPGRFATAVEQQARHVGDAHLGGDVRDDPRRHSRGVRQERAQVAHGAELHREAEPEVIAAAAGDHLPVAVIEVERAGQVGGRRLPAVAAVARLLLPA
jgi:hypothetical protein